MNAPGEIMRLVNRLMSSAQPPEDMFLHPPDEEMVATVREVGHRYHLPKVTPNNLVYCF
jgi:hypothetical protein